jgi:hypothetical protein
MSLDKGPVIQAGENVIVTLTPSGGNPPYTYRHFMSITERGKEYWYYEDKPDNVHTWLIGYGEKAYLKGIVYDADWKMSSCEMTLEIQGGEYKPITVTSESLSPGDVINLGDTITYTIFAEGGDPPYTYGYKLSLYQNDCWLIPVDDEGYSSNSLSYTVTRGTEGSIYSSVRDSKGRETLSPAGVMFKILGDDTVPMDLSATYNMKKLGANSYRFTIQAGVKSGTLPVTYQCWWELYKNGIVVERPYHENTEGNFALEGDYDLVIVYVDAIDADGWKAEKSLKITFDVKNESKPIISDWVRDQLKVHDRRYWLNIDNSDLIDQLHDIPLTTSTPFPILDVKPPKVTKPELKEPKVTEPVVQATEVPIPEVIKPEIIPPSILNPQILPPATTQPNITVPGITAPIIRPPNL